MTFDCVGRDSKGQMYMKFHKPFSIVEQIQLLERSILVNSFAYYELNDNILSDAQYDRNAMQLAQLKENYPKEFTSSRYYRYFSDYCSDDGTVYTSGFALLEKVRLSDYDLYCRLEEDARLALEKKGELI